MKLRGFEIAKGWEDRDIRLPRRSTAHAAGYDIEAGADVLVPRFRPGIAPTLIPTGLKAYCQPDECYFVFNRSSGAGKGAEVRSCLGRRPCPSSCQGSSRSRPRRRAFPRAF